MRKVNLAGATQNQHFRLVATTPNTSIHTKKVVLDWVNKCSPYDMGVSGITVHDNNEVALHYVYENNVLSVECFRSV